VANLRGSFGGASPEDIAKRIAKEVHENLEVTLLKNLCDHRARSSATVTVGHAQNLSVLGTVTVIIKIESGDLDRRPALGRCPKQ